MARAGLTWGVWHVDQLIERMEEVVGAAAIVNSELRSLQRQHMSLQFLLQSAQERLQGQGSGASGNKVRCPIDSAS